MVTINNIVFEKAKNTFEVWHIYRYLKLTFDWINPPIMMMEYIRDNYEELHIQFREKPKLQTLVGTKNKFIWITINKAISEGLPIPTKIYLHPLLKPYTPDIQVQDKKSKKKKSKKHLTKRKK